MHSGAGDPQNGPGFPIRRPQDQRSVTSFPGIIAGSHVLHRLSTPRHPPYALWQLGHADPTPTANLPSGGGNNRNNGDAYCLASNRVRFVSVYKKFDHNLSKNQGRINAFQRSHEPRTIAVLLQSEVSELSTLSGVVKLGWTALLPGLPGRLYDRAR